MEPAVKHLTITIDGKTVFDADVANAHIANISAPDDILSRDVHGDGVPYRVGRMDSPTTVLTIEHGPHVTRIDPPERVY
jgi:hypothetical protein